MKRGGLGGWGPPGSPNFTERPVRVSKHPPARPSVAKSYFGVCSGLPVPASGPKRPAIDQQTSPESDRLLEGHTGPRLPTMSECVTKASHRWPPAAVRQPSPQHPPPGFTPFLGDALFSILPEIARDIATCALSHCVAYQSASHYGKHSTRTGHIAVSPGMDPPFVTQPGAVLRPTARPPGTAAC